MFNPLKEMANDAKSLKTLSSNAKEALLGMSPLEADGRWSVCYNIR